ncbi:hypothetical protein PHJA_001005900 [Phtheirospermum japonicum]|uniref:Uncharacterized protein n=1 Tax=Phtheirospermum japonicum TaxID=374723 RepID=A0A830BRG4_9LAMI|nr:hypothetical protein PHJA_001005900 [Phtheirospermum japonicum]
MVANHQFTRIDTLELKNLIYRKIGHQRAEKYFDQLKRFLTLKLSKSDFDKSCTRTIGKDNIALHNKLIRSILQNACQSKTPPQKPLKPEPLNVKTPNGYQRNCMQSLYGGDAFPRSPRKCRSPVNRDRKFRDRPSPLGPLGKSPSLTCEETFTRTQEPLVLEEGEEVEQFADSQRWGPVTAPFGVSVNPVGVRKTGGCTFGDLRESCENRGELPDTRSLWGRLEKKLAVEGLGVSLECADLLNNGLDVFLKRLIEPCIGISKSRLSRPTNLSMVDFRVAMESNPRVLGEDWSIQLEKITFDNNV